MSLNSENLLSDNNKTKLNNNTLLILKYWYTKCKIYYKCHKLSSFHYKNLNKYLGIPGIFVGIINTATLFTDYQSTNPNFNIINGVLSLLTTSLYTLQNYFELNKIEVTHSKLSSGYHKIATTIEKILMYAKISNLTEINSKIFDNIMTQMEYLQDDAPYIPDKIWKQNNRELKEIISSVINKNNLVNELSSSIIDTDLPNNNENKTNKSKTNESKTNESKTNESKTNESKTNESKTNNSDSNENDGEKCINVIVYDNNSK